MTLSIVNIYVQPEHMRRSENKFIKSVLSINLLEIELRVPGLYKTYFDLVSHLTGLESRP